MTSIKDVAKLAGVSVMTASRAINRHSSVSVDARNKVLKAAKTLDYRPNLTARSLRVSRSQLIGLLLPDIENPVFASLAKHVEEAANRLGYNVILGNTWEDHRREAQYIELMLSRRIDGIILSPVSPDNHRQLCQISAPVVQLDRFFHKENEDQPPFVGVDNREVGRMAARHLAGLGHRHFACIPGPLHIGVFAERLEGFREELSNAGHQLAAVIGAGEVGQIGYGAKFFEELLRICPLRPLALFCANDLTALGAIQAANRLGFAIPGDVSVIGVDDIPAGNLTHPTLTSIRQPVKEIADAGVELLVDMLTRREKRDKREAKRPEAKPKNIILMPRLVVRESTGPFKQGR